MTDYRLDDEGMNSGNGTVSSLRQHDQTGCRAHTASYSKMEEALSPGLKR